MRNVRICENESPLELGLEFELCDNAVGHLIRVLRFKAGDTFTVFDGKGREFKAVLLSSGKSNRAKCLKSIARSVESPLQIELGQVISRGDRMDFTIQKAVELGIYKITPLYSNRCGVKLDAQRGEKKLRQWQKIALSACEQCGRNYVPEIAPITTLESWCQKDGEVLSITLDPNAQSSIADLKVQTRLRLLAGPEGGLEQSEIALAKQSGFTGVRLGPRILRTETAALAALCIIGAKFGDLN